MSMTWRDHPALALDIFQPVLDRRNPPTILLDMLFTEYSNWYFLAIRIADRHAKDSFGFKNALSVMTYRSMPKIGVKLFGCIEPVMQWQVIFIGSPVLSHGRFGMIIRVHQSTSTPLASYVKWVVS